MGDNDGAADWRTINEFAYLISSVPACERIRATIYNAYWDHQVASNKTGQWEIYSPSDTTLSTPMTSGIFSPTVAFRDQLNQYPRSCGGVTTTAGDMVQVLGNKLTFNDALAAGSGLADLLNKAGVVTLCSHGEGACLSTSTGEELMHAKYALLQQAKDSTGKLWNNVTWITSSNLNGQSGGYKSNVSVAIFGDSNAYTQLNTSVWDAEVSQTFTPAYLSAMATGIVGSNSPFTFYPSPRSASSSTTPTDFEAEYLASQTNAKLGGTKTGCQAYVVQSLFSSARNQILNGLAALQSDKCTVDIVLGESSIADVVDSYFSLQTSARQLINKVAFGNVHDKTMTLSYTLNGTTTGTTWGGSENYNGTSLQYDELAFRADDLTITRAVEQQSARLYLLTKSDDTVVPVTGVSVGPNPAQIPQGKSLNLNATITPTNASVTDVTWQSSDPSVATVDGSGGVTGVSQGTVTITATSISNHVVGSSDVTVVDPRGTGSSPEPPVTTTMTVTSPPVLTTPNYQSPTKNSTFVVTWAQGQTDLTGKVDLQYWSGGTWKKYQTISVNGGRGTGTYHIDYSHTWRARAASVSSPAKATIASSAVYSRGYGLMAVRHDTTTSTIRVYAPNYLKTGATAPFLISWLNPYRSKYKSTVSLQFLSGSKWKTVGTYTFTGANTQYMGSSVVGRKSLWRAITSTSSQPKGVKQKVSSTLTITTGS